MSVRFTRSALPPRRRPPLRGLRGGPAPVRRRPGAGAARWLAPALAALAFGAGLFQGPEPVWRALEALAPEALELRRVRVIGARELPARHYAVAAGVVPGASLARLDLAALEARLREDPWVRSARVWRVPPRLLVLQLREREPRAVVADRARGDLLLVDDGGRAFARAGARHLERLPRVTGQIEIQLGQAHPALLEGVKLMRALERVASGPLAVETHAPSPRHPLFRLRDLPGRVVLGRGDWTRKLERLEEALRAMPEALEQAAEIDLRFADQLVLRGRAGREDASIRDAGDLRVARAAGAGGGGAREARAPEVRALR